MQSISVLGSKEEGAEEVAGIDVDVEPAVMPTLKFEPTTLNIPIGFCVDLSNDKGNLGCGMRVFITGTYSDGKGVDAEKSTQLRVVSRDPSIVRLSSDGCCLLGISEGSTKVTFADKYSIEVTAGGRAHR
jgi:hypothetical protein